MVSTWLGTSATTVLLVVLSGAVVLIWMILLTRVIGLRTFSKMSTFDFAITVAAGSVIASITVTSASLANGMIGLVVLFGLQVLIALGRSRSGWFTKLVDNTPLLLLEDGVLLEDNMRHARVTRDDVMAKLREANCLRLTDARAVVLETTGDVAVLHGQDSPDPALLEGVRRTP